MHLLQLFVTGSTECEDVRNGKAPRKLSNIVSHIAACGHCISPAGREGENWAAGRRLGFCILISFWRSPKRLQRIPLADGAQRLAAGQPLVYAL